MSRPLANKVALITGGGSGIGRAVALLLARDGARIIAADCDLIGAEQTVAAIGADHATALHIDVTSSESIQRGLRKSFQMDDCPTILVNSAGITRDNYLLKMSDASYDEVYNVNLRGTFLLMKYFVQSMIDAQLTGGSIVNISSIVAKLNNVGQANYAATKAGVVSLTKVAAKEFGRFGVRVNCVLPGFIDTPMVAAVPPEKLQYVLGLCPLNRVGRPAEVAEVISFLASDRSSYVNGAGIEVTGGL